MAVEVLEAVGNVCASLGSEDMLPFLLNFGKKITVSEQEERDKGFSLAPRVRSRPRFRSGAERRVASGRPGRRGMRSSTTRDGPPLGARWTVRCGLSLFVDSAKSETVRGFLGGSQRGF